MIIIIIEKIYDMDDEKEREREKKNKKQCQMILFYFVDSGTFDGISKSPFVTVCV